jgi:hypothetical protein
MTSIPQRPAAGQVVVGVDTHKHLHVAVALDHLEQARVRGPQQASCAAFLPRPYRRHNQ